MSVQPGRARLESTPTVVTNERSELERVRAGLLSHRLYEQLNSVERVRIFMKHHVFAVWDFFSLLKRLQQEVTCVTVPWLPRGLGDHARFITEIVISEECDEAIGEGHISHFELYLAAMAQVGADRRPIERYIDRISSGADPITSLDSSDIPPTVRGFTSHTLQIAIDGELHEVAASFCHGRENLLADVFSGAHTNMKSILDEAPILKHYLERHITLDHDDHGPLALNLLDVVCDGNAGRIDAATRVAIDAIKERGKLWDGVLAEIKAREATGTAA
jgi:hypothetical protein